MINLLPPDVKQNYLYARKNTKLLRWSLAMAVSIAGIFAIVIFGQLYIDRQIKLYTEQAEQTTAHLQAQQLGETQKRVSEISSSLQLVVQVLSRQVLFSELIRQVGAAIPPGATLSTLQINKLEGGTDLQFDAVDYATATQIQVNLEDPNNKIFEKADILNINCAANTTDSPYPCKVSIRALFSDDNPFLFISDERTN